MPRIPYARAVLFSCTGIALALFAFSQTACSSPYPNQNPVGQTFPTVTGESLEEVKTTLPDEFAGEPAILLIGYKQRAQFDIDRWIMGLIQARTEARIVEVPTIPGLVPSMASGWIDDGMRAGIPKEDWSAVVTLYGDAAKPVAKLTGTESGNNARVLLLDKQGEIVWFWDQGYSAKRALEVSKLANELAESGD